MRIGLRPAVEVNPCHNVIHIIETDVIFRVENRSRTTLSPQEQTFPNDCTTSVKIQFKRKLIILIIPDIYIYLNTIPISLLFQTNTFKET